MIEDKQGKTISEEVSERLTEVAVQSPSTNALCSLHGVPTTSTYFDEKAAEYDFDGYSDSNYSSENEYNPSEGISDTDSDENNFEVSARKLPQKKTKK